MTYRNPQLLALARLAPRCMGCRTPNDGDVVAAHSNQTQDGKGMGIKASDAAVAFLCFVCHGCVDQRRFRDPEQVWERAHRATMRWLIESGHLAVVAEPKPYEAPPKKPSRKIRSAKAIPSRPMQNTGREIPSRPFPKVRA